MSYIVGTDYRDQDTHRLDRERAHQDGIPHRAVHIEIIAGDGRYLVWERRDGRLEIPGGHVDWNEEEGRAETYDEAALREAIEELNLKVNWDGNDATARDRLKSKISSVCRLINQLPSNAGNNNEWVTVFQLRWDTHEWGNPEQFRFGEEGNTRAQWLSLEELVDLCTSGRRKINAALRLLFQRHNVLIPNSQGQGQ